MAFLLTRWSKKRASCSAPADLRGGHVLSASHEPLNFMPHRVDAGCADRGKSACGGTGRALCVLDENAYRSGQSRGGTGILAPIPAHPAGKDPGCRAEIRARVFPQFRNKSTRTAFRMRLDFEYRPDPSVRAWGDIRESAGHAPRALSSRFSRQGASPQ